MLFSGRKSSSGKNSIILVSLMRFLHRWLAVLAISLNESRALCVKGKVTHKTLSEINNIANTANITKGEIWLNGNGKVRFSGEIPQSLHQKLRNCMVQSQH
ncbi:MAG: DUF3634 family protein [Akkermansiaceae bacterium]